MWEENLCKTGTSPLAHEYFLLKNLLLSEIILKFAVEMMA